MLIKALAILVSLIALIAIGVRSARAATLPEALADPVDKPSAELPVPSPRGIAEIESDIRRLILAQGPARAGELRAWSSDGALGYRGTVELASQRVDFASPEAAYADVSSRMSALLEELDATSALDADVRWYYLIITVTSDQMIDFEYFREVRPLASIKELRLDEFDSVPDHVFIQRFDAQRLAEISDSQVDRALMAVVPARLAAKKPVSPALLEIFATVDWDSDVNNGGLDQYYARRHSDFTGEDRRSYYPLVYAGLNRMGAFEAAALFAESMGLWAHFYPEVEETRAAMKIAAVPRQETSDIGDRFYQVADKLYQLRAAYLRSHAEVLEEPPTGGASH